MPALQLSQSRQHGSRAQNCFLPFHQQDHCSGSSWLLSELSSSAQLLPTWQRCPAPGPPSPGSVFSVLLMAEKPCLRAATATGEMYGSQRNMVQGFLAMIGLCFAEV